MDFDQRDYFNYIQNQYQQQSMASPASPASAMMPPYITPYMVPAPMQPVQPFPMMYSYAWQNMDESETERDLEYMKQMYPDEARRVQKKVEEACDQLEYEGSMMYDEYPDRVTLMVLCDRIMDEMTIDSFSEDMKSEDSKSQDYQIETYMRELPYNIESTDMDMQATDCHGRRSCRNRDRYDGRPPRSLVEVMLYNEMHKRRCKQRKCRRFW